MDLKWRKMLNPMMPMANIAPMLSVMKSGTSYYGFSKCIRGYSTVASASACKLRTPVQFRLPAQGNIQQFLGNSY